MTVEVHPNQHIRFRYADIRTGSEGGEYRIYHSDGRLLERCRFGPHYDMRVNIGNQPGYYGTADGQGFRLETTGDLFVEVHYFLLECNAPIQFRSASEGRKANQ